MNYWDALRLATGSVVVSPLTHPPFVPCIATRVMFDDAKKQGLVHAKVRPDLTLTLSLAELDAAPPFGRWDEERRAWLDRRTGEQLLPKPNAEGAA